MNSNWNLKIDTNIKPEESREIEVIKKVAEELTNSEIAEALFISEHTVKTHIDNIRYKLAVSSKSGITAFAYKRQLIQ